MKAEAAERELEKAVFGDEAGFRENLNRFQEDARDARHYSAEAASSGSEADFEALADADLFVVDTRPSAGEPRAPGPEVVEVEGEGDDASDRSEESHAAWHDSSDERISVSLASTARLRKLRQREDEDVVSGTEYIRRLRRHYEKLHPRPAWATEALEQRRSEERRRRGAVDDDTASGYDDATSGSDDPSAAIGSAGGSHALADLLRNVDLGRQRNGNRAGRQLGPEVVDIQRLRDVGDSQPSAVTSLAFHPTLPLLLSSGQSATVYLHHIKQAAEDSNPLMLSVHVKNTPLHTTVFHPDPADGRIFLGGRRRFFHVWDPAKGIVEKVARVYGHQAEQKSMERFAISPSGAHLALVGSTRANSGIINILDGSTLQWVCQLRVESHGGVSDFAWWPDSSGLSAAGKDGVVTEWSLVERRTVGRWTDEGAVGTTTLALGGSLHADGARGFPAAGAQAQLGGHRWVAIGSSAGIVNVYDRRQWMAQTAHRDTSTGNSLDDVSVSIPASPKPVRTLDQLTTPVSHLHFSPDGQLLVMATRWKKGGLRLVHLPSCTVYRNWPTSNTPLGRISSVAWSEMHLAEKDGMARSPSASEPSLLLAVGSENGKIRLWQLVA